MIRLENVTYDSVDGMVGPVDFHLPEGRAAVLLGPHKSGKTDFLKVCMGFHPLRGGRASLMGREVGGAPAEEYGKRNGIAFISQNPSLLDNMTIEGNISLPIAFHTGQEKEEVKRIVRPIMERYDLLQAADSFPNHVSHDDAKMAQLARAAALTPRMIFLDEPTAGDLDPGGFLRVVGFIKDRMAEGCTLMITTCSPSLASQEGLEPYILAGTSFSDAEGAHLSADPMISEFLQQLKEYTERQSIETVRFLQSLAPKG